MSESIETKREEFRKYLEESGVVNALTNALIKLYEEEDKPECAVKFVRQKMCEECPTEEQYNELKIQYDEASGNVNTLNRQLLSLIGNMKRTPSEIDLQLEKGLAGLQTDETCISSLKKYLTSELFEQLKTLKTGYGSNLLDCIQSGLEHHDSGIGVYAPDPEAYQTFADLFDPIIEEYHNGFNKESNQPELNWGDPSGFDDLDPEKRFIISTRIRCARSIENFPFNTRMNEKHYEDLMNMAQFTLEKLEGDFQGKFYPLLGMEKDVQDQLTNDHFLFKEGDRFLVAAKATRFWPLGRGIFYNKDRTVLVWVNEEDHLRFISMEPSGNVGVIYQRLIDFVHKCNESFKFIRCPRLGYLTFCPTNLGTTIRASVHIRIPKLFANESKLNELATQYNLQVRGTFGEHTGIVDGVLDISNKRRMGLTEFEAVHEMYNGISEIIKIEKEMEEEQN